MLLMQMTEEEFHVKVEELSRLKGIHLLGPVGKVTKDGVTAGYTHAHNTLTVHIIEKPIFVSRAYCECRIEDWLAK